MTPIRWAQVDVHTEDDLARVALIKQPQEVRVQASIPITRYIVFVDSVRLVCEASTAGFTFPKRSPWIASALNQQAPMTYDGNGLNFRGPTTELLGVRAKGYEGTGGVMKVDSTERLVVDGCDFRECGNAPLLLNNSTQVISATAHVLKEAVVENNRFMHCSTNHRAQSHVLYIKTLKQALIRGNYYEGCGNPWGVLGDNGSLITITGERFHGLPNVWDPTTHRTLGPWLGVLYKDRVTITNNVALGTLDYYYAGYFAHDLHIIDANEYPLTPPTTPVVCDWGVGWYTLGLWKDMGLDTNSVWGN